MVLWGQPVSSDLSLYPWHLLTRPRGQIHTSVPAGGRRSRSPGEREKSRVCMHEPAPSPQLHSWPPRFFISGDLLSLLWCLIFLLRSLLQAHQAPLELKRHKGLVPIEPTQTSHFPSPGWEGACLSTVPIASLFACSLALASFSWSWFPDPAGALLTAQPCRKGWVGFPPPFPSAYFVPSLPPACLEVRKAPGMEEEDGEEGCSLSVAVSCHGTVP